VSTARLFKLPRVQPTAVYHLGSTPCEKTCASIVNKSIDGMETNDIAMVAYRYLQTKAGARNTFYEGSLYFLGAALGAVFTIYRYPAFALVTIGELLAMQPASENYFRYAEASESCEDWLRERLSPAQFVQVQQLSFDQKGLDCLVDILKEKGCETKFIEEKADELGSLFDFWSLKEGEVRSAPGL
jgi:hypothetical protein